MKHYYYYIEAGSVIDETTKFYRIAIGASAQDNRDYLYLIARAQQHNHYFEIVTLQSQCFIEKCLASLRSSYSSGVNVAAQVQTISAREFVKSCKHHCANPLNQSELSNRHQTNKVLSIDYRISSILKSRN